MGRASAIVTAGLLASLSTAIPLSSNRQEEVKPKYTTFEKITPSPELKWADCYGENLRCAYLTVPLDYSDPSAGTTNIAFQKYVFDEDAEDLLYNPGGPGQSGVVYVEDMGPKIGKDWGYNFVSFDPRGIYLSGPAVSCEPANDTAALTRRQLDEATEKGLRAAFDERAAANKICADANKDTDAKYIGTVAVVQDMMHYVELQAAAKGQDPKSAKINYYGISYGTVIGQTLVALYPDRLNRVLLDGNVYGVAFYQGWYSTSLDDLAHAFWMFAKLCFEAGPEWCKLAEGMKSIDEVKARFDAVLTSLDAQMPLGSDSVVGILKGFMYAPTQNVTGYRQIADFILDAETGVEWTPPENKADETFNAAAQQLITAVDIAGRYPWKTYEAWRAATERERNTAPYGPISLSLTNGLSGLGFDDFVPPPSQYFPGFDFVNTSVPVLFVNTAGDPVTPMSAVHAMSELFGGSSWFIQNSPGHGYMGAPSRCTKNILAAYFADASVPKRGTWCEPDVEANYYFGANATKA